MQSDEKYILKDMLYEVIFQPDEIKGFGNIDNETPEFAISLFKEYRNKGIGTDLMIKIINYLLEKGYKQTSLSVAKNNYALKLYKKLGFKIIFNTPL